MAKNKFKNKKGFTIIEMMIAITIFLVVIIYGMQALLNVNFIQSKSRDMRSILDSLTFTLDDMSKNIRTGSNYHCINTDSDSTSSFLSKAVSGKDCIGIAFESSKGISSYFDDQWIYYISNKKIYKSTQASIGTAIQLTPDEVEINEIMSGFDILGAESPTQGDRQQPLVNIRLVGVINGKNNTSTPFSIQTSVSQRLIDVGNFDDLPS